MTFASLRRFVVRYERHLSVLGMAGGFLLDNAALKDIVGFSETLLLTFYFISAGLLIIGIHYADTRLHSWLVKARPWLVISFQIIIGSWYSAFLVFYSHSASVSASWPFLLILFVLFAGTEIFKHYQDRLAFQNAMYFFAIFTYATAVVPIFVGAVGTTAFFESGAVSVLLFAVFLRILYRVGPARLKAAGKRVIVAVASVFILINVFYFAHLLPPLPLELKDIGVYHTLVKESGAYAVGGEPTSLVSHFFGDDVVHIQAGNPVYVFSSVYTPVAIHTDLVHRWQYWDTTQKQWVTTSVISFPVVGGRDEGYRGFSEISGIREGAWRVSVETPDGALIGRIAFSVVYVPAEPPLVQSTL